MIEKIVYDYLTAQFPNVPVVMEIPETMPERFILIEKTGGGRSNYLYTVTFAIQSYADSLYEAATLNEDVKQAMFDIIALNEITRIQLNSDYNFTDTSVKKYRYQAVFDMTHY